MEFHIAFTHDNIKCLAVLDSKHEHVVCWVPSSGDVSRHDSGVVVDFVKNLVPSRKQESCRVFDSIGGLAELCAMLNPNLILVTWRLTLVSNNLTSCRLSSSSSLSHSVISSCSSIQPLQSSSSSSSFPLLCDSSSSRTMSPASANNSLVASSRIPLACAFSKSNCLIILFTTRFMTWRKQQVWLAAPGKSSRRSATSGKIPWA